MPAGAYTCEPTGLITYFNQQAVALWGRAPKLHDPVDRYCGSFRLFATDGSPIDHGQCWMALALKMNQGFNGREIVIERPDGQRLTVLAYANPVHDEAGSLLGAVNVLVDISERKRAEESLRQLEAELAHMGRVTFAGEMAGGLAHELNQPLGAITTYAEAALQLLNAPRTNPAAVANLLEKIIDQGIRAGEIIHRLRSFLCKTEPRRSAADINALVREAVQLITPEARLGEVKVRLDLAAALPPVAVDAIQIQQVVLNLVRNALDALQEVPAGQRSLSIRTRPADGQEVEVTVIDTGPGLPAEAAAQLFQPFFTTKPHGMGLGLSLSRSIIESYGGRLWTTATSGRGSIFHFTVPAWSETDLDDGPLD
ncbi:MAG: ATP-binding protein [Pseudomonadota bacterium]|nr:ATP-binding protein [Pseudomonadota bacterium]